jgi:hypothetical protein
MVESVYTMHQGGSRLGIRSCGLSEQGHGISITLPLCPSAATRPRNGSSDGCADGIGEEDGAVVELLLSALEAARSAR